MEHSPKFEIIKDHYESGQWKMKAVKKAVNAPNATWRITPDEYEEITGEIYEV